jgi:hypothetical protein
MPAVFTDIAIEFQATTFGVDYFVACAQVAIARREAVATAYR